MILCNLGLTNSYFCFASPQAIYIFHHIVFSNGKVSAYSALFFWSHSYFFLQVQHIAFFGKALCGEWFFPCCCFFLLIFLVYYNLCAFYQQYDHIFCLIFTVSEILIIFHCGNPLNPLFHIWGNLLYMYPIVESFCDCAKPEFKSKYRRTCWKVNLSLGGA